MKPALSLPALLSVVLLKPFQYGESIIFCLWHDHLEAERARCRGNGKA